MSVAAMVSYKKHRIILVFASPAAITPWPEFVLVAGDMSVQNMLLVFQLMTSGVPVAVV